MVEITLSRKQSQAIQLLDDPTITELLFGGGAGGGKSWLVCLWMVIQCRKYPGITIGLGRKELSNLGKTTARTLLDAPSRRRSGGAPGLGRAAAPMATPTAGRAGWFLAPERRRVDVQSVHRH
jgi:hypothetical protein